MLLISGVERTDIAHSRYILLRLQYIIYARQMIRKSLSYWLLTCALYRTLVAYGLLDYGLFFISGYCSQFQAELGIIFLGRHKKLSFASIDEMFELSNLFLKMGYGSFQPEVLFKKSLLAKCRTRTMRRS